MSLRIRSFTTTSFLGVFLLFLPSSSLAQDRITVTQLDDAVARSQSEDWYATAETGEEEVGWQAAQHGLEFLLLFSPDSRFLVLGEPVETGLDVVSYRLFLFSLETKRVEFLSDMALGATFAPTSDYLLISTGPNPMLYNLATRKATPITQIQSGVENYPVWVAAWSADGKVFTLRQQQRFDNPAEPLAWTLQIE